MKKYLCIFCFILTSLSGDAIAYAANNPVKIAFEKDGFLWIQTDGKDEKITTDTAQFPYPPQWSHDGRWLLYQKQVQETLDPHKENENELWVYNLETKTHKKIFYDGHNPQWAPNKNIVAFQSNGVLNISDLNKFYNITLGVDDYSWFPNGKSFIASSSASLRPDGWTNPVLFTISVPENLENTNLTNGKPLFTIPKELSKGAINNISINAGSFAFSPDPNWISFIVSPTASLSMDGNMLCVIRTNGENFEVLDEIIFGVDKPQWANTKNKLGYIAGGGRIVFGFINKRMKITELPAFKTEELTPANFAELGFTWVGDDTVIVSRVKETEWSNDPKLRPNPSLYSINIKDKTQTQITKPKRDKGDYQPRYLSATKQIIWLRKNLTDFKGDLWIANPNGKNPKLWIKNIGEYAIYPN